MKLNLQSACQLAFLSFCCVLLTARESDSTFVPGRCQCPHPERGVRGQLAELKVYQKSPRCNQVEVIVTLKRNNMRLCLSPDAPMGKQLIRCWNRAHKMGRDPKLCLRRRRRGQRQRQRSRQRSRSSQPA